MCWTRRWELGDLRRREVADDRELGKGGNRIDLESEEEGSLGGGIGNWGSSSDLERRRVDLEGRSFGSRGRAAVAGCLAAGDGGSRDPDLLLLLFD